jgi:hypothetical protein
MTLPLQQQIYHIKQHCLRNFGFQANPKFSLQKNFNDIITTETANSTQQMSNLAFHNLCKHANIPQGTRQLLGLNLKYCLACSQLNNNINTTVQKMPYAIRTTFQLQHLTKPDDSTYIKQIYIKNKTWNPEPAPLHIEDKITSFEKILKTEQNNLINKLSGRNLRNLTYPQSATLRLLKQNNNLTIKPADKNMGPAKIETKEYVSKILKEHLLTTDYEKLTKASAKNKINDINKSLKSLITDNLANLSKAEIAYFQQSFKQQHRIPIFYGLPKVHKTPISFRPIVSSSSSFLSIFSVWLDFKMKSLLPFVQSYIKNSTTVINDLKTLHIPEGALLFSADAKSMYTNISTGTGVSAAQDFIASNAEHLPTDFPTALFLQILTTIMENNIFTFAGTFWKQLSGTAMGTPAACAYATITYGHHENTSILPRFKSQLIYYKRYIDDIFGICPPLDRQKLSTWNNFKKELINWGSLEWIIEDPSTNTVFLDLNLQISGTSIKTSTFQKSMNLYLYIPPCSSHPPSCLKGLISGELRRYYLQNNSSNFQNLLTKFIRRLLDRGHKLEDLTPLLLQAASAIDRHNAPPPNNDTTSTLYLHWTYHPDGLQRQDLRQAFDTTLKDALPYDRMQVAISRPKNLRDILTETFSQGQKQRSLMTWI